MLVIPTLEKPRPKHQHVTRCSDICLQSQHLGVDWSQWFQGQSVWSTWRVPGLHRKGCLKPTNHVNANWIQEHIKKIIHHDQTGFFSKYAGMVWYKINKCDKLHDYLTDAKKGFLTKSSNFHVKIREGTNLNVVKDECGKFTISIILNGRNSKAFPGLGWRWLSS